MLSDEMASDRMHAERQKRSNEQISHRFSAKRLVDPNVEDYLHHPILN
jgi:hypothetical protein